MNIFDNSQINSLIKKNRAFLFVFGYLFFVYSLSIFMTLEISCIPIMVKDLNYFSAGIICCKFLLRVSLFVTVYSIFSPYMIMAFFNKQIYKIILKDFLLFFLWSFISIIISYYYYYYFTWFQILSSPLDIFDVPMNENPKKLALSPTGLEKEVGKTPDGRSILGRLEYRSTDETHQSLYLDEERQKYVKIESTCPIVTAVETEEYGKPIPNNFSGALNSFACRCFSSCFRWFGCLDVVNKNTQVRFETPLPAPSTVSRPTTISHWLVNRTQKSSTTDLRPQEDSYLLRNPHSPGTSPTETFLNIAQDHSGF